MKEKETKKERKSKASTGNTGLLNSSWTLGAAQSLNTHSIQEITIQWDCNSSSSSFSDISQRALNSLICTWLMPHISTARAPSTSAACTQLHIFTITSHRVLTPQPPPKNLFSHPSFSPLSLPLSLPLTPSLLAMSQRLNPSHFLSLQKHHYTSQRETGGEERRKKRLRGGRREVNQGDSGTWRHIIAGTRFQRIDR